MDLAPGTEYGHREASFHTGGMKHPSFVGSGPRERFRGAVRPRPTHACEQPMWGVGSDCDRIVGSRPKPEPVGSRPFPARTRTPLTPAIPRLDVCDTDRVFAQAIAQRLFGSVVRTPFAADFAPSGATRAACADGLRFLRTSRGSPNRGCYGGRPPKGHPTRSIASTALAWSSSA